MGWGALIVVNTEHSLRRKELGTNAAAAPVQKDETPPSLCYQRGSEEGGGQHLEA